MRNDLCAIDHFEKLGFMRIGPEENGVANWRLDVKAYCEKSLPRRVEIKRTDMAAPAD